MTYTKELIDEIKEIYPTFHDMIYHAMNGHTILGKYLDDSSPGSISNDKILSADSLEELQREAMLNKRKTQLYHKWYDQYTEFINKQK